MKIKLKFDIPIGKEHGMTAGRVFDVIPPDEVPGEKPGKWVMGDAGVPVKILSREHEVVDELPQT